MDFRKAVLELKQPRRIFVQSNTEAAEGGSREIVLKEYEASPAGAAEALSCRGLKLLVCVALSY